MSKFESILIQFDRRFYFVAEEDCNFDLLGDQLGYIGTSWSNHPSKACTENGKDICKNPKNEDCYFYQATVTNDYIVGQKFGNFSYINVGGKFQQYGKSCNGSLILKSAAKSDTSGKCEFEFKEDYFNKSDVNCINLASIITLVVMTINDQYPMLQMNGKRKGVSVQCDNLISTRNNE